MEWINVDNDEMKISQMNYTVAQYDENKANIWVIMSKKVNERLLLFSTGYLLPPVEALHRDACVFLSIITALVFIWKISTPQETSNACAGTSVPVWNLHNCQTCSTDP